MQILTTAIIKGGTGKTTTAAALAQAAVQQGQKVLAIDLDPQGNLSYFIGADTNFYGAYELITGERTAYEATQQTEQKIDAITASPDLATLRTGQGTAKRLSKAIEPIKENYDLIIIDTPPQIGEMTYNALQACSGLIIPLEADSSSVQGLYQISDIANQMKDSNPNLKVLGVLITRYDGRPKINRYLLEAIKETAGEIGAPFLGAVRAGIAIREAQGLQKSLYEYAAKSKPALDYMEIYNHVTQ